MGWLIEERLYALQEEGLAGNENRAAYTLFRLHGRISQRFRDFFCEKRQAG